MKTKTSQAGFTRATAGFTLVEMMVAVGIFVIVAFVVTTAFLSLADANRKAQNIRLVMDNLNFAIDSMALKMREGSDYVELTDPSPGITFKTSDNEQVTYSRGERPDNGGGAIYCVGGPCGNSAPITAPQINVKYFKVKVSTDNSKKAVLLISGEAGSGKTLTTFNIQTTVSERK